MCTATLLALVVTGFVGSAVASGPARLSGSFHARVKVTKVSHLAGTRVGESKVVVFSFKPSCSSGGCTTVLRRHTFSGAVSVETLHPAGSKYKASLSTHAACVAPNGQVRTSNGYKITQTLSVTPASVTAGKARAFSGSGKFIGTPTASGKAHRCHSSNETFTFKSVP
jgi:hypothetical protein